MTVDGFVPHELSNAIFFWLRQSSLSMQFYIYQIHMHCCKIREKACPNLLHEQLFG